MGKRRAGRLDVGLGVLASVVLAGNPNELKVRVVAPRRIKLLPPGQLLAAASPRPPPENQRAFPAKRAEIQVTPVQARQGQAWEHVSHVQHGPFLSFE